ncbi:NAD(P)-dependent alcohol dehydrogenase [Pyxidicoccus xibeiensis]|uniref:NAD(P)-dependent alcohol dehydrogenase n=1 Tax=Pyxidicoccus xibeiensis TaxID=2906759 RepID=UPI0020A6ED4B|nr:NAD(P)-dependent alcohol dehydrogenase [Pyxidicoccus xibeiensis]MCP3140321.1 NAD(P)-dependent alcohol dehydrogenase [Pyxidicoccus xibeiensis]
MKAIVCPRYGSPDVLRPEEVETPVPRDDEVLLAVRAASVNAADAHLMRGEPFVMRLALGLRRPRFPILGSDVAGRVVAVGKSITQLQPGDEVFGDISDCGFGAFAEYVCAREKGLLPKPANLTFEQAAAVPMAAVTALHGLRDIGRIQAGQRVLVHGASGGVGSFAVQLARSFGAEVTGVCGTGKQDMVRALGADHVIDSTREDVTRNGKQYDLIFDAAAYRSLFDFKRALSPTGVYVLAGGSTGSLFQTLLLGPLFSSSRGRKFRGFLSTPNRESLTFIKELIEAGKVVPFVDRQFPLSEVPDAIRHLEARRTRGKVVITM